MAKEYKLSHTASEINQKLEMVDELSTNVDELNTNLEELQEEFSSHTHDSSDITSGTISVSQGGTGHATIEDKTYTTARYRASSLHSKETTPTVNGVIAWYYE